MPQVSFSQATKQRPYRKWHSRQDLQFYSDGAVTTTTRYQWVVGTHCKVISIVGYAGGTGSGAGSTQVDIRKNGTSLFQGTQRFSIASADNGIFNGADLKNDGTIVLRPGDVISLHVTAVPATAGHSQVAFTIVLS